jgi:hypothetical protein
LAQSADPYGPPETVPPAGSLPQTVPPQGTLPPTVPPTVPPSGYAPPPSYPPYPPYPPPVYAPPAPRIYAPPPVIIQPYYVYPAPFYARPVPPVIYRPRWVAPPPRKWDGVRRFSLGVHAMVLGLNQSVGKDNVVLGGAGLQFRLRGRGRWGMEIAQSFLGNDWWNGNYSRRSYPFQLSLMLYFLPNDPDRHFNMYAIGGVGGMYDQISLLDENRSKVTQDFWEWEFHGGLGLELRYHWFGIEADARAHGFVLDNDSAPARYYNGVSGGPIPSSSYGFSGNVFLSAWF